MSILKKIMATAALSAMLSVNAAQAETVKIALVVNTPLHFDHAGGNTRVVDGKTVPAAEVFGTSPRFASSTTGISSGIAWSVRPSTSKAALP